MTVRRRWLQGFAARSTAPTGAEQLIVTAILQGWANIATYSPAWNLLGTTAEKVAGELAGGAPRGRALQIALVLCLASWEHSLEVDAWHNSDSRQQLTALVLQAISQWGYELSTIEEHVVDASTRTTARV